MAGKYRNKRDEKPDLRKTISSFSDDPELNKARQVRRNDDVKLPDVGLIDIDTAMEYFLTNGIKPTVEENGTFIPVPVMYSNPEMWASAQRDGYLRDEEGKIITPLITFKRSSVEKNPDIAKLKVLTDADTSRTFVRKYTQENKYDPFSILIDQKPVPEYYIIDTPDYVNIQYDVILWCDFTTQLNTLVEQIVYHEGGAYGERFKFEVRTDSYTFDTVQGVNEDRLVRSELTMTSKAYLLPKNTANTVNATKAFGTSKVVWDIKLDENL